jgi:histidinol-phosphate aminotransferase
MKKINTDNIVNTHVKKMSAYSSARAEYKGKSAIFLDANENSIGSVTQTIHNRYPDPLQIKVKEELAKIELISIEQIFLGNGSDECIDVLIRCFCESGNDSIMTFPPVFSMYEHAAHIQNIGVEEILLLPETFQLDMENILLKIESEKNLKIIFICSPNNPTGNLINKEDIETILNKFDGLVVVDEAYQDFSGNTSWVSKINEFENLVVIKTFSKVWGMADARIGMLFSNKSIIDYMNIIKMPYNVNQNSQNLALEALQNIAQKNNFVVKLNEGKEYLLEELNQISYIQKVYPSDANFLVIKTADANHLYNYLTNNHIIVRNRDKAPLMKGCLRISIGTKAENEQLINILKKYTN